MKYIARQSETEEAERAHTGPPEPRVSTTAAASASRRRHSRLGGLPNSPGRFANRHPDGFRFRSLIGGRQGAGCAFGTRDIGIRTPFPIAGLLAELVQTANSATACFAEITSVMRSAESPAYNAA